MEKLNGCIFRMKMMTYQKNIILVDIALFNINNTIWDKLNVYIKNKFDSEPFYSKEFLKNKIKSHGDEVTDFSDKNIRKVDYNHTCLAVISLDSAFKETENCYPQVFL